ncbi:Sodium channel protein Nach [Trachymyrmex cornetzi]|uniref:Sodium channel protein Nach n=1 Tax=Trachymyrmex cornetzi TaxID=471704 RepID=A0A195DVM7_9HYME|nr:Sodium channel protein Nach [Trachymyrmex cornetzi]
MLSNTLQHKRHRLKRITVSHVEISKKTNEELVEYPIDNRPVVKSKKEIIHKLLQEYLYDSSVHGMKYFSNLKIKSSIIGKLFWTAIIICSFVFLTLMLHKFWERYNANPIRSIVKSFHVPIFMAPFPALTICPLIPPPVARRNIVFASLRLPSNMSYTTGRFLVRYGPAFANENAPGGRDHIDNFKLLLKTNNLSLIDFIKALRPCEDIFESCAWQDVDTNCSKLFKVSYTFAGICCSFNYYLEESIKTGRATKVDDLLTTPFYGPRTGLQIVLNRYFLIEDDDIDEKYIKSSTNSVGLVVFSHHPLEYVATIATRQILQKGQYILTSVNPIINKKLSGYYHRDSTSGKLIQNCADEKIKLDYFPTYGYSNCFTSCSIKAVLQACGCLPLYYTPIAEKHSLRLCEWEDFQCLYANADNIRIIQNVVRDNYTCECFTPCQSVQYELQTSRLFKNISTNQSILKIYMKSATFIEMDTIPIADELYLLGK